MGEDFPDTEPSALNAALSKVVHDALQPLLKQSKENGVNINIAVDALKNLGKQLGLMRGELDTLTTRVLRLEQMHRLIKDEHEHED